MTDPTPVEASITPEDAAINAASMAELQKRVDARLADMATASSATLEARVAALEAAATPAEKPHESQHCWAPVLDHGGQVPVYMIVDPVAQPVRMIATTRGESLVLHFQCCRCPARGERRFRVKDDEDGHGKHRSHHEVAEFTPLPAGPCPGAKA